MACLTSTSAPWVIDYATDHLSGVSNLFTSLQCSSSLPPMSLADGSTTSVEGIGTVEMSLSISLSSVLYVPRSPFNLMSVSKLTKNLNSSISLSPN